MTREQEQAFERIQSAPLVGAEEDLLFTRKLAEQNGWSVSGALEAIEEYRRFLFLAMHAAHPVSPSDAVDQVWHQHLLYTNAYWKEFCPNVLGRPFHHEPGTRGKADRAKFEEWYRATLASYRLHFGEPAQAFWPALEGKIAQDSRIHRRIDLAENWIVPKPAFIRDGSLKRAAKVALFVLLVVLASGCSAIGNVPPWNMRGPDFLLLFLGMCFACWFVAFQLRKARRVPIGSFGEPAPELEVYETAYLGGGVRRLTQAVLGKLEADGVLRIDEKTRQIKRLVDSFEGEPVEEIAFRAAREKDVNEFQQEVAPYFEKARARLVNLGLLVAKEAQRGVVVQPTLIAAIPLLVGAVKLYFGVVRDRPVGILIVLEVLALIVALGFCRTAFRSRKGDMVLKGLQEANKHFASQLSQTSAAPAAALGLTIALFGAEVLANTPYAYLQKRLGPESSSSGGCGSGCGGSSGSGGGGGCGGGCGGCGG